MKKIIIVNEEEARSFANGIGGLFQLVSAKTGDGINDLFNQLVDSYFRDNLPAKVWKLSEKRKSVRLIKEDNNEVDGLGINDCNPRKSSTEPKQKNCC